MKVQDVKQDLFFFFSQLETMNSVLMWKYWRVILVRYT